MQTRSKSSFDIFSRLVFYNRHNSEFKLLGNKAAIERVDLLTLTSMNMTQMTVTTEEVKCVEYHGYYRVCGKPGTLVGERC